ncbi:hypothetical protein BJ875DRAFT_155420 [Amylocarpus encephaloides]|uniref:MARVEL domain-containing protein n=1 Tax=Amylocarpus encephaloides TaxID=45428 RepID=A0A9P8C2Y9_9HELO|nr:hypothetical protein BJ875DRAFT_155420 [Amylocarpus encephaloides]
MATITEKRRPPPLIRTRTSGSLSSDSSIDSLKVPRTPRFAEATTVYSPIDPPDRSPFADPIEKETKVQTVMAQSQPSDIGFGYISQNDAARQVEIPQTPGSPLKSAMKVPGTPARKMKFDNPLSPTFQEEQILDKHEDMTEKEQAKDLKVKTRVRMAKFLIRGTSFVCSLIVLSMVSMTFSIFRATKHLGARNNLPPWAANTKVWPQVLVLSVACVSLVLCIVIFWNYFRGGHKRAEKVAVYYTLFAVAFFIFSVVMWGIAAGVLQGSHDNSNNKDIWGWSCVDNKRRQLFQEDIDYGLVCRMQSWSLVCAIIEIVIELIAIILYAVVFYRYYSKQRLRKSMDVRDRARSDLYLAQLRTQSAPNTPGFGPLSPSFSTHMKSPRFPPNTYGSSGDAEEGLAGGRFVEAKPSGYPTEKKPFTLQAPPIKVHAATPKTPQGGFAAQIPAPEPPAERIVEHVAAAPGEQTYDSVPIPGAYASPAPTKTTFGDVGTAMTSDRRIDSPPGSPRGWDRR